MKMYAALWKLALVAAAFVPLGVSAATSTDICTEVSGTLTFPNPDDPSHPIVFGPIEECICFSLISSFVANAPVAKAAVAAVGKAPVTSAVHSLFKSSHKHTCHYPEHSNPMCSPGNPCGFTCRDGFSPFPHHRPTKCVCNKPHTVCNGRCGPFKGCPSGRPIFKRSNECDDGLTSCPVPGRGGGLNECVDTQTHLENCGGCMIQAPDAEYAIGQDCSAIAHAGTVSCMSGQCVVSQCAHGYVPSELRDSCTKAYENDGEIYLGRL